MVRNKKARTKDQKYAYIKLRISKAQAKAKRVGFFYLLGLVVGLLTTVGQLLYLQFY